MFVATQKRKAEIKLESGENLYRLVAEGHKKKGYYVDSNGGIWSSIKPSRGDEIDCSGELRKLKPSTNRRKEHNYPSVNITCKEMFSEYTQNRRSFDVHRLVAETLVPKPIPQFPEIPEEDLRSMPEHARTALEKAREAFVEVANNLASCLFVNHIDHDKTNFHPSNLEWVNAKQNAQAYQKHKNNA
jgi:hypothetical protein